MLECSYWFSDFPLQSRIIGMKSFLSSFFQSSCLNGQPSHSAELASKEENNYNNVTFEAEVM